MIEDIKFFGTLGGFQPSRDGLGRAKPDLPHAS